MATKRMNDSWKQVKNKIQTIWSEVEFEDQEMKRARGSLPQMVNLIHKKTGEPRGAIMQKMAAII